MACRGCLECLLKLLNFLMTLMGLTMVGYGIYLFVEYKRAEANNTVMVLPATSDQGLVQLGRPMLMAVSLSANVLDNLPKAWFIYLFIGVGVVLFVISCFGCVGASTRNGCCLSCYSVLVILLILVELGCAAFIFFDKTWKDEIPTDKTGYFDMIYDFLKDKWTIVRWVALGIVILQALMVQLQALMVRAANRPVEYDSDDEILAPRQQIRQPFLNWPPPLATGVSVAKMASDIANMQRQMNADRVAMQQQMNTNRAAMQQQMNADRVAMQQQMDTLISTLTAAISAIIKTTTTATDDCTRLKHEIQDLINNGKITNAGQSQPSTN